MLWISRDRGKAKELPFECALNSVDANNDDKNALFSVLQMYKLRRSILQLDNSYICHPIPKAQ